MTVARRCALFIACCLVSTVAWLQAFAADVNGAKNNAPKVELNSASAQPRQLEDTTEIAISRDYSLAWKTLAAALNENRADALDAAFVGIARQKIGSAIEDQKKAGLHRRYTDRGHKLQAIFYSPEGSAMELRDTAQLEVETLDGNTVIHREQITQPYLVLMTVAEGSWKVRVLEELPK
jgi:5-enolpyruvylshikimate-3-phosphate synthase